MPNIVDLTRFRFALRAANVAPHLVVTRNLEAIYDIPTAMRAFATRAPGFPGGTPLRGGYRPRARRNLEALAASLGIADAVRFAGRSTAIRWRRSTGEADLMLNPSRVDNMPNSVLEALACGLPVVSTRVGGVPYIVRDGVTALLVDAGDAEAMAAAVLRLLRDAELAARARRRRSGRRPAIHVGARASPACGELYERVLAAADSMTTA